MIEEAVIQFQTLQGGYVTLGVSVLSLLGLIAVFNLARYILGGSGAHRR